MRQVSWIVGTLIVALLLSLLILLPGAASAQHVVQHQNSYAFNHACYPSYSYYSYKAPVTYGHSYNHNYHHQYEYQYPVQKVIAQEIAVAPLIVTVPVDTKAVPVQAYGAQYYYSVGEAYQAKAAIRDVIREELRNLIAPNSGATLPTPGGRDAVKTPPAKAPEVKAGPSEAPDTTTPAELQTKVLAAFQGKANCVSCHGAGASLSGNFRLVKDDGKGGYQLVALSSDKRWKTYAMSSVGAMPPAAASDASKAMESEHLPSLLQWAAIK